MENSLLNMTEESEDCVDLTDDSNDAMMLDISTSNKLKENPILVPNFMFKPEEQLRKIEANSIWNFQSEKNKDLEDLIHRVLKNKKELEEQSNPNINTLVGDQILGSISHGSLQPNHCVDLTISDDSIDSINFEKFKTEERLKKIEKRNLERELNRQKAKERRELKKRMRFEEQFKPIEEQSLQFRLKAEEIKLREEEKRMELEEQLKPIEEQSLERRRKQDLIRMKTEKRLRQIEQRKLQRQIRKQKEKELRELKKKMELEEQQNRKENALKGMTFLLGKSQVFSKFLGDKLESNLNKNENEEHKSEILNEKQNDISKIINESQEIQSEIVSDNQESKSEILNVNQDDKNEITNGIQEIESDIVNENQEGENTILSETQNEKIEITNESQEEGSKITNENQESETKIKNDIPKYFTGGTLRPYQVEGLTWLKLLHENGINGILADEMGLGKTIQVIALIAHLYEKNIPGPYLIIAPLSVTTNWREEFKKFAPKLPVVFFYSGEIRNTKKTCNPRIKIRQFIKSDYKLDGKWVKPIVVTTYQVAVSDKKFLGTFNWKYIILDEAQYIKNCDSQRYKAINNFPSLNRLLLTGTPLQNDLSELWALLHFLMPKIFGSQFDTTFTTVLNSEDFKSIEETVGNDEIKGIISTIHGVLNPFLLRRLKQDVMDDVVPKKEVVVYCPLSDMQRTLTKYVIERNLDLLSGKKENENIFVESSSKRQCSSIRQDYNETDNDVRNDDDFIQHLNKEIDISQKNRDLLAKLSESNKQTRKDGVQIIRSVNLASPWMALRELANHPYLLHMPTVENKQGQREIKVDENLITTSGKMRVLDLLLPRLKAGNHKVLIYSCFVMMLDIVEEYLIYRNYNYARLDGGLMLEKRQSEIDKFCSDEEIFVFLISTRSGGVGLNLVEADTVIFMDLDCNPQADVQAQDRCHRIGQTKPVVIYKFLSLGTIDEKIYKNGEMKRRLEKVIIQNSRLQKSNYTKARSVDKDDLLKLLKSLESTREVRSSNSNISVLTTAELDELMDRSDLYKQLNEHLAKINAQKENKII
ncbi:lymphoid-specific helicase-like [Chrysoperla carnea]|uniref:lymphoid-specific helicase-like n=1 Tax=Chrysoperla carnea TaxID=189513 RepID=UPI001D076620|nr:lymphoid-specific helicase-like [Chrysoperla carnea]